MGKISEEDKMLIKKLEDSKIFHVKISDNASFFCGCSYLFTFSYLVSFIDIHLKSTAYFFDPPCIYTYIFYFHNPE